MNREQFLKSVSLVSAATFVLPRHSFAFAKGSDKIKVGIVGIGSRGTDALTNMFDADNNIELVAIGDAFSFPIERAKKILEAHVEKKRSGAFKDFWKVSNNIFTGLDAIDYVVKSEADVIILATPPIFRPEHIKKCLDNSRKTYLLGRHPAASSLSAAHSACKREEAQRCMRNATALSASYCRSRTTRPGRTNRRNYLGRIPALRTYVPHIFGLARQCGRILTPRRR